MALFDQREIGLSELTKNIYNGKIQLPNFQRKWVWDINSVKELVVSILKDYPIGAITVLEVGNNDINLSHISMTNVPSTANNEEPEYLVLDGQQRVTAIYQSMFKRSRQGDEEDTYGNLISDAVYANKKQPGRRGNDDYREFYLYIDMKKFLEQEIPDDNIVIVVDQNKKSKKTIDCPAYDLSDRGKEIRNDMFPVKLMLDEGERTGWGKDYWGRRYNNEFDEDRVNFWEAFNGKLLNLVNGCKVQAINLGKGRSFEAVCNIFEKVNSSGVKLTIFELLTASYFNKGVNLKDCWESVSNAFKDSPCKNILRVEKNGKTKGVSKDDFLKAVTLYTTKLNGETVSCKEKAILSLSAENFNNNYIKVKDGYIEAAKFLGEECGIYSYKALPYKTQLLPLAAIFASLNRRDIDACIREKISKWFWASLFGGGYESSSDTQAVQDFTQVIDWIQNEGAPAPRTVSESSISEQKFFRIKTKNTLVKGIIALLQKNGAQDFYTARSMRNVAAYGDESDPIEIHHIFPQNYCESKGIPRERYDTIINKTPLCKTTNCQIKNKSPYDYRNIIIQRNLNEENADQILRNHLIDVDALKENNFDNFYSARLESLISLINEKTGRNDFVIRMNNANLNVEDDGEEEYDDEEYEDDEQLDDSEFEN